MAAAERAVRVAAWIAFDLELQIEGVMRDEGIPLMRLLEPAIDVEPVQAGPDGEPEAQVP